MCKYFIKVLKNKKQSFVREDKVFINNSHNTIKSKFYIFKNLNVYSKKEKDFFIIPKGEFVKIEDNKYAPTLYKIKYKKKKFLVSKEEFDYCAFNCESNYNNCFEIIEDIPFLKLNFLKKKTFVLIKSNTKFKWENNKKPHSSFTSNNLMLHIFSHIYESFKYADNEIFSSFTTFYINNLQELLKNLERCKEKSQILDFILVAEPLFVEIKNNILQMQENPIYIETTKDLLDNHIIKEYLDNYKEIVKDKKELFQYLRSQY